VEQRYADRPIDYKLFESMPVNSLVVDATSPDFIILAVTDDYLEVAGVPKDKLLGSNLFEVFPGGASDSIPDGALQLRASFEFVIKNKKPHRMERQRYDVENAQGVFEARYWSTFNKPVLNAAGEVVQIIHTVTEITGLVVAEESRVLSSRYDNAYQLFMQAPMAVCIVRGLDYVVQLANQGMLEFLGRDSSMIGKPIIESLPEAKLQGLIDILDYVRTTGQTKHLPGFPATLLINGVREDRYFDLMFRRYEQPGADTSIFCLAINVTEEVRGRRQVKEMTEKLNFRNAIFEAQNQSSHDGVLIIDPEGRILLYNNRFVEIWGMREEVLAGKSDQALLDFAAGQTTDRTLFFNKVNEIYQSPDAITYDELNFKDGRVIGRTGTPVIGENGEKYGWAWNFRDITERIQQERKFRNVLEQAPTPIFILKGPDLVLEVANKPLLDLWAVDETAIGKPLMEILPELVDQPYVEQLRKVFLEGKPHFGHEQPAYFIRQDGVRELHYFNYTYQPYKENNGIVSGVLVIATDVTERVLAMQKIRDTEANFKTLLMQAPIGICILRGKDFEVELVNDSCLSIIQRRREDMLGRSLWVSLPELKHQGFPKILEKVRSTGFAYSAKEHETVIVQEGIRQQVFLDFVYQPLTESAGVPDRIMVVVINTTTTVLARKKIEEAEVRARLAVESGELGTYEVDLRTNEIIVSERMSEIMGVARYADRKAFIDAFVDEDKHIRQAAHRQALTTGRVQYSARIRKPDDSIHWVKVMGRVYFDDDNKPFKLVGVTQDITEQKLFSDELSRLVEARTRELLSVNEELQKSNTELEQFAYISSHDLQEPLRKIKVYSSMIIDQDGSRLTEASLNRFNKIVDAAERMTNSLRDLLEFASLSNNDRFEQVDLKWVIENVKNDLELVISQKNAHIEYHNLPVIRAIPLQMHQLFYNLMNNALKFSRPGINPLVRISCRVLEASESTLSSNSDSGPWYEIAVVDNGIGFDAEYAEKIFTIFKRLHNRDTYSGTGIGLSICRKVVHNHGGEIYARSDNNQGATFTIHLPGESQAS